MALWKYVAGGILGYVLGTAFSILAFNTPMGDTYTNGLVGVLVTIGLIVLIENRDSI